MIDVPLVRGDRAALIAAIIAFPEEDTPRLMYADWLDENSENGNVQSGFGKRAVHIRWAVANPQNSAVCLCGCIGRKPNPCETCQMLGAEIAGIPRRSDGESHYVLNRGFVSEIRLPLAVTFPVCRMCLGGGYVPTDRDDSTCEVCHGIGHTPGFAAELVRRHPLTRIMLMGKTPYLTTASPGYFWIHALSMEDASDPSRPNVLPDILWQSDFISEDDPAEDGFRRSKTYASVADALAACSDACLELARRP